MASSGQGSVQFFKINMCFLGSKNGHNLKLDTCV